MFKNFVLNAGILVAGMANLGSASALGAVSRACQFSQIPISAQSVASKFFVALGADADTTLALPFQSETTKQNYFVNESLTTDYFQLRYYLYAYATVYSLRGISSTYYNQWQYYASYMSDGWRADRLSDEVRQNDNFKIFFANRGILYSARAGLPKIIEYVGYPNLNQKFAVEGSHYYYDPVTKVPAQMRYSRAIDCNLQNWGQGTGLWDR